MGFNESYKHLEKLCGELLSDDRRVTAYIEEMLHTPMGSYYVKTWEDDLKKLKHYRWLRNQISHEPGCTEENMCEPEDALWIDAFYARIMNQTDPLSLYRKATRPCPAGKSASTPAQNIPASTQHDCDRTPMRTSLLVAALIGICLLIVAAVLLFKKLI